MTLRVLIADDELLARRRLARLLTALPDVELVGECADGGEVLARVRAGAIDAVLLDIQMPGLTGMEALQLWPENGPVVVLCTAHADHAVQAFDAGAIDYLLKPVEPARLHKALERARSADGRRRFHAEQREHARLLTPPLELLAVRTRSGIVLVAPEHISHAVLDGELVTLVICDGRELITELGLQELLQRLPPDRFERVHRRALLNMGEVSRLDPLETGGYLAQMKSGHTVEISRQSARELRKRLGLRKAPGELE